MKFTALWENSTFVFLTTAKRFRYMTISYQRMTLAYDFKARNSVYIFQMVVMFYGKTEYPTEGKVLSLSTQGVSKRENVKSYIEQKTKALINLHTLSAKKKLNVGYLDNIEGKRHKEQFLQEYISYLNATFQYDG